jgi:hypothetical protein
VENYLQMEIGTKDACSIFQLVLRSHLRRGKVSHLEHQSKMEIVGMYCIMANLKKRNQVLKLIHIESIKFISEDGYGYCKVTKNGGEWCYQGNIALHPLNWILLPFLNSILTSIRKFR